MKSLLNFVDQVYCIHDITRNERSEIYTELKDLNPKFIFADRPYRDFQAPSFETAGVFGNTMSHLKVLVDAYKNNYKTFAIFEDDAKLNEKADANKIIEDSFSCLPSDWGVLYLGGNPGNATLIKNYLYSSTFFLCTFSYIINSAYLGDLITYYIDQLGQPWPRPICDNIIKNFFVEHKELPLYAVYPFIFSSGGAPSISRPSKSAYDENFYLTRWKSIL